MTLQGNRRKTCHNRHPLYLEIGVFRIQGSRMNEPHRQTKKRVFTVFAVLLSFPSDQRQSATRHAPTSLISADAR
jgi:hypothetical protein